MSTDVALLLPEEEWRARRSHHEKRVRPWVEPRQQRTRTGRKHPVDDFLFEYYPYSVAKLTAWHPGHGFVLGGDADAFLQTRGYVTTHDGVTTSLAQAPFRPDRLELALRVLDGTANRAPMTGCFGLHEWAMVYGLDQADVRHASVPLRLTPQEIRAAVDEIGLRCTHIDAFRFFTPEAVPLNSIVPTRATQPELEQPGCLHASMDLYKYAMWFSPYVGSDLVADCFDLARQARALDMQASPYDCADFGLEPVRMETPEGRAEYARRQRELTAAAAPLRERLATQLQVLRRSDPAEPAWGRMRP